MNSQRISHTSQKLSGQLLTSFYLLLNFRECKYFAQSQQHKLKITKEYVLLRLQTGRKNK